MKVSLYVGDEIWDKFRRTVLRRTGDPKTLSSEVQNLIKDSLVEDTVVAGFEKMKVEFKPLSSMQIAPVKPSFATSAEASLREMRGRRHDKTVSRQ
jgi:hypothetical protein